MSNTPPATTTFVLDEIKLIFFVQNQYDWGMPRGGYRPGAGRPREGYQGKQVYVSLTPRGWEELERLVSAIRWVDGRRSSRLMGLLLLEGARVVYEGLRRSGRLRSARK